MPPRRDPLMLAPGLGALMLVAFALSGLLVGLMVHGLVVSTAAGQQTVPKPTATSVHVATATATLPAATGRFDLSLSVNTQRVTAGQSITVTARATMAGTDHPMVNLLCTLSGPDTGPSLLPAWPTPQPTDSRGLAVWQITIPNVTPGTYAIQVKASTKSPIYGASRIVLVFVTS